MSWFIAYPCTTILNCMEGYLKLCKQPLQGCWDVFILFKMSKYIFFWNFIDKLEEAGTCSAPQVTKSYSAVYPHFSDFLQLKLTHSIPMGLLNSPIKIWGKSVQGFLSYDWTNRQTDIKLYKYTYILAWESSAASQVTKSYSCRLPALERFYRIIKFSL